MIKDLNIGDTITAFMAIRRSEIREYNATTYIVYEFGDASGRVAGVWWEPEKVAVDELQEGDVVKIRGIVQEYRGKLQIRVSKLRRAETGEYDLADILAHSQFTKEELKGRLLAMTEKIENGFIKTLVESFWKDERFFDDYLRAAAGKLWHHAFIGGLAEHSLNVTDLCLEMARRYPKLERDHLIFGGLFHDVGKIDQYVITSYIDYSDEGRLVGHINTADYLVTSHAGKIDHFPPELLMRLRHLLLAHHGQKEFGSPVVPMTPEAFILNFVDEIDSKMGALERIRQKTGSGWSEYVNLLDRMIYFGKE
jgi:3'-5' exoribonuclease